MPIVEYPFRIPSTSYSIPKPAVPIIIINPNNGFTCRTWGLIDTGADASAIPEFIAKSLGHNIRDEKVKRDTHWGIGGDVAVYLHTCRINILRSSPDGIVDDTIVVTIPKRKVAVIPGLHTVILGEKDFLEKYILNIDYPRQAFSIRKPKK